MLKFSFEHRAYFVLPRDWVIKTFSPLKDKPTDKTQYFSFILKSLRIEWDKLSIECNLRVSFPQHTYTPYTHRHRLYVLYLSRLPLEGPSIDSAVYERLHYIEL